MNILLIYPEFPDTFWSFKNAVKFIGKNAALPPLGLVTVAALLPKEWQKRVVDLNVRKLTGKDLEWADYAFISAMIVQRDSAYTVIRRCKEAGLKIVAGGPLFTAEYRMFQQVDHFVLNEAELTLGPFLRDLEAGAPERIYSTEEFADIQKSPVPLWELADMKKYASMSVQYSRGCPFDCEFCNVTALFGHRPRHKTPDQIIAELDCLYQQGWRSGVFFVDDNLIGNVRSLKTELLPALIQWRKDKRGFSFNTEASINLADDQDLMDMMVRAGFNKVFIGIETPDEISLAECSKNQNLKRDLISDVKRIQRAGIQVQGGFIVGFDNDTPSSFKKIMDFIQKSGIVTAMVGLLQALPDTRLYKRLKRAGRLNSLGSGDNVDGTTNIIPVMEPEILQNGYKKILNFLYAPRNFYRRVKLFLIEYRPSRIKPPLGFRYTIDHITALFRSVFWLGIIRRGRFYYWKLIFWTLFHRPREFPLAITLLIYGYHFRQISKQADGKSDGSQGLPQQ